MKISILQAGKTRFSYLKEGIVVYHERIRHYINFEEVTLPDLKNTKNLLPEEVKNREGDQIIKSFKPTDFVVLLDEKGKEFNSTEFAEYIQKKMNSGKDLIFVIGGAYGFSKPVYAKAGEIISLSRMTFSHQLVRLILAEQLYRAFTIIRGEPYHHS